MIKNVVIMLSLVFLSSQIHAFTLDYYDCPNKKSSLFCSKGCKLSGKIKFEFKPELNLKNIFITLVDQNNTSSLILKECDIENIKNWKCDFDEIFSSSKHYMVSGKYLSSSTYRMLDGEDDERFSCARD